MSTGVTSKLTQEEQLFKTLIWDPLITAGETALFAALPVLNAPVLGTLDHAALSSLSDWIFSQICLFIDITTIRLQNSAYQSAYDQASESLKIIALDKGVDSDDYKTALAANVAALSQFARFMAS